MSEGWTEQEMDGWDRWIGAALMWMLYQTTVVKKELSQKTKLSIIYLLIVTYGHELWLMPERMRLGTQAVSCVECLDSLEIGWGELGVDQLLLCIESSTLWRLSRHLQPRGRPRIHLRTPQWNILVLYPLTDPSLLWSSPGIYTQHKWT